MPAHHKKDSESQPFAEDTLVPATTVTASGALGGSAGWGDVDTIKAQVIAAAVGGTSPSYTVKLQQSQDGQNWVDIGSGAAAALTANGSAEVSVSGPFDDNIRAFATVTGTSPTASITVLVASTVKVTDS